MSTFNCKMCGGTLEIQTDATVVTCDYCGTQQTLPKLTDEKRTNLYDRANHFRRNNDFDKAMAIYEQILDEDQTDAEAYWSLVLCQYGIEYVEDPITRKRIPTVNRAQFTSIFDDDNYKSALQYADSYQRRIYQEETKAINEIQKGILAISQNEEPFDIFICYKESDNNGRRTPDSVLAQDLYYQLTDDGFKVFFSRITLEDKLGTAYEPYIFAALNSAKVMVVLGTKPEYFNAVWVKNEWSRFLALVKSSRGQKMLIPAYRDMNPYDLPEEFSHLQAQDMSKLGFMQDLTRGIKKLVAKDTPVPAPTPVSSPVVPMQSSARDVSRSDPATASLVKRMMMFLGDGEWTKADEYCERILDIDPECSKAYIGKLMAKAHIKTLQDLHKADFSSSEISKLYDKACKFSNPDEYDLYKSQYNIYEEKKRDEQRRVEAEAEKAKATYYIGAFKARYGQIKNIDNLMASGNKIEATRFVCEITGFSFAEAKKWVENYKTYDLSKPQGSYAPYYIGVAQVDKSEIKKIDELILADKKWDAITLVCGYSNMGLDKAKTWVENYKTYDLHNPQSQFAPSFAQSSDTKHNVPQTASSSKGLSTNTQAEIEKLEKRHKNLKTWGIICIFLYWPIGIGLLIGSAVTKNKIKKLKEGKRK